MAERSWRPPLLGGRTTEREGICASGLLQKRKPLNWTFRDFCIYAQWYSFYLVFELFDPEGLKVGQVRFRDKLSMKAVFVEELLNGTGMNAAYFSYIACAVNAFVEPPLEKIIPDPEYDKLLKLAEMDAVVFIPENVAWPIERAAHLIGMELLKAKERLAVLKGLPKVERSVESFVLRVTPEKLRTELKKRSGILLVPPKHEKWAKSAGAPSIPLVWLVNNSRHL